MDSQDRRIKISIQDQDFPLRNAKRAVEKHLKESGLVYTILRPSIFRLKSS
jgi:uncharacterized protein YbjT (DUF2867 family)